ncbi:MAG TPA: hypothetical protein VFZ88_04460 [Sphingomicrobium sp.]
MPEKRIVAIGLLTQREVELLGHGFSRLWPVDETPCFTELIKAIDEADRELEEPHLSVSAPSGERS